MKDLASVEVEVVSPRCTLWMPGVLQDRVGVPDRIRPLTLRARKIAP